MSHTREYHTATVLLNGNVLVTGGLHSGNYLDSAELYVPSTEPSKTIHTMNNARNDRKGSVLINQKLLVIDGYNGTILNSTHI
jgi:hypothetical protein